MTEKLNSMDGMGYGIGMMFHCSIKISFTLSLILISLIQELLTYIHLYLTKKPKYVSFNLYVLYCKIRSLRLK